MTLLKRWAWLIFAVAILFAFLGSRGLNEPDEGRYAELGREMVASGQWLVPHLNGFEHFQKPPIVYWATATFIRLLGPNEWAVRLPSALAAIGTAILTFLIARRLFDRTRAVAAAVVLVSSVEFFALARLLTPDMVMTFFITAALACFVYERKWLFFICLGLGFMTKGPMALVVPISAVIAWRVVERRRGLPPSRPLPWARGLALTFAIGLSWFVALSLKDRALFDYFWRYELVERFASHAHGRSKPFWFFIPILILGFIPWIFWLPARARAFHARWKAATLLPVHGLFFGWLVPPFLILTLSGSKLPTYILPLFPALAIVVAAKLRAPERIWKIALPTALCFVVAAGLAPKFEKHLQQQAPVRKLAELIEAQPDAKTASIFACGVRAHGFEFYLQRLVAVTEAQADIVLPTTPAQKLRLFSSPSDCEEKMRSQPKAYGVIRSDEFNDIFKAAQWSVLGQSGDFLLISNAPAPAH